MKEAEPLEYGKLTAKDYIPGAEILPETSEVEEQHREQGGLHVVGIGWPFCDSFGYFVNNNSHLMAL